MKKIIAIVLTVITGATGYFGAAYAMVGLNPIDIISGSGYFFEGEYIRDDDNAVLYIEKTGSASEFRFELHVKPSDGDSVYETEGVASVDRRSAYFEEDGADIVFYSERKGVISVTSDVGDGYASPDGTYRQAEAGRTSMIVGSAWPRNPGSGRGTSVGGGGPGGGGGGNGNGNGVTPSTSQTPDNEQHQGGGTVSHNCSPEGAFQVMVLMLQDEEFGGRGYTEVYTNAEFEEVFNYYSDSGSVLAGFKSELDDIARELADKCANELGLDRGTTDQFVRDMMRASIDWLRYFEYELWGVEYESDDVAYVRFGVSQQVEFDFQEYMNYTVMEKMTADYDRIANMNEQQIANYFFEIVRDYLINPQNYGAIANPHVSYELRAIRLPNSCWVIGNYQDYYVTEIFFSFGDDGLRLF